MTGVAAPAGPEAWQPYSLRVQAARDALRTRVAAGVLGEDAPHDGGGRLVDGDGAVLGAKVACWHGPDHEPLRGLVALGALDLLAGHPALELVRRGEGCVGEAADSGPVEPTLNEDDLDLGVLV